MPFEPEDPQVLVAAPRSFEPEKPGDSPESPIESQPPEIGLLERFKIKTFGEPFGNQSVQNYLRSKGLEAAERQSDRRVAIKSSADGKWYVLDPAGGGIGERFKDVLESSVDVGEGVASGIAAIPGMVKGAALGSGAGPAGTFIGGALGGASTAGAGAAAYKAGLAGLSKGFGFDPENVGREVLRSGAAGAVGGLFPAAGQLGTRVGGAVGRKVGAERLGQVAGYLGSGAPVGAGMSAAGAAVEGRLPTSDELQAGALVGVAAQALGGLPTAARSLRRPPPPEPVVATGGAPGATPEVQAPPPPRAVTPEEIAEPDWMPADGTPVEPDPFPQFETQQTLKVGEELGQYTPGGVQSGKSYRVPTAAIGRDPERMQFKQGADRRGVVDPLQGDWDEGASGITTIWERNDGKLIMVDGHHRLAHAEDLKQPYMVSRIYREADGYTIEQARAMGAMSNIRNNQGTAGDYARFFRGEPGITEEVARQRGLLRLQKGQAGFGIGRSASDDVYAAFQAGAIKEDTAAIIAMASKGDPAVQAAALKRVMSGKRMSPEQLTAYIKALGLLKGKAPATGGPVQGTIPGFEDTAFAEADAIADVVADIQAELNEGILAARGAVLRPDEARKMGVDIADPAGVQAKIRDLKAQIASWENWAENPELYALARQKAGLEPTVQAQGQAGTAPEAPPEMPAEAPGQMDLFGTPEPTGTTEPPPAAQGGGRQERIQMLREEAAGAEAEGNRAQARELTREAERLEREARMQPRLPQAPEPVLTPEQAQRQKEVLARAEKLGDEFIKRREAYRRAADDAPDDAADDAIMEGMASRVEREQAPVAPGPEPWPSMADDPRNGQDLLPNDPKAGDMVGNRKVIASWRDSVASGRLELVLEQTLPDGTTTTFSPSGDQAADALKKLGWGKEVPAFSDRGARSAARRKAGEERVQSIAETMTTDQIGDVQSRLRKKLDDLVYQLKSTPDGGLKNKIRRQIRTVEGQLDQANRQYASAASRGPGSRTGDIPETDPGVGLSEKARRISAAIDSNIAANIEAAGGARGVRMDGPEGRYAIISPSAKKPGKVQLTMFDKDGPSGDTFFDSTEDAIRSMSGRGPGGALGSREWKVTERIGEGKVEVPGPSTAFPAPEKETLGGNLARYVANSDRMKPTGWMDLPKGKPEPIRELVESFGDQPYKVRWIGRSSSKKGGKGVLEEKEMTISKPPPRDSIKTRPQIEEMYRDKSDDEIRELLRKAKITGYKPYGQQKSIKLDDMDRDEMVTVLFKKQPGFISGAGASYNPKDFQLKGAVFSPSMVERAGGISTGWGSFPLDDVKEIIGPDGTIYRFGPAGFPFKYKTSAQETQKSVKGPPTEEKKIIQLPKTEPQTEKAPEIAASGEKGPKRAARVGADFQPRTFPTERVQPRSREEIAAAFAEARADRGPGALKPIDRLYRMGTAIKAAGEGTESFLRGMTPTGYRVSFGGEPGKTPFVDALAIPSIPWSRRAFAMGLGITGIKGAGIIGARIAQRAGKSLQRDTGLLRKIAESGPEPIRGMAAAAYEAAQKSDPRFRVIAAAIAASPVFRDWVASGEADTIFPTMGDDRSEETARSDISRRISGDPQALAQEVVAGGAPPDVVEMAERAISASQRGDSAYRAAVSVMLSSPSFRAWASAPDGATEGVGR